MPSPFATQLAPGGDDARLLAAYPGPGALAPTPSLGDRIAGAASAANKVLSAPLNDPAAFGAAFDEAWNVNRLGARDEALRADLWQRHADIEKRTGKLLPRSSFMVDGSTYFNTALGEFEDTSDISGDRSLAEAAQYGLQSVGGLSDQAYEAEIEKRRAAQPNAMQGVATGAQVRAQADARLNAIAARAGAQRARNPAASFIGGLAGSAVDPINLAAMAWTGPALAAEPWVTRSLLQAPIWGSVNLAQTPAKMAESQRSGGPEYTLEQGLEDAGMAALTAPLVDMGFHGVGKLARWALNGGSRPVAEAAVKAGAEQGDAMRGTLNAADQAGRDAAAINPVRDGGDYGAAVQSLQATAPPPSIEFSRDFTDLFGEAPPGGGAGAGVAKGAQGYAGDLPPASPGVSLLDQTEYRGRPIYNASVDPRATSAAPELFQYKAGGDDQGVTERLRGVRAWDPTSSGKAIFFEDGDGRVLVADGHQRRGLALRMDQAGFDPRMDGLMFRSADGWSAGDVRTVAALKNIREGSGNPLDAAKVFRDAPAAMADDSLPVSGEFIRQAKGLARLNDEAFGAAVNKIIPERYAAEIGHAAGDRPDLHAGMVRLLREGEPASVEDARALVHEALLDDWVSREGAQADMFGGVAPQATTIARAKVKAAVVKALRQDQRLASTLVRHADAIEAGGNTLARDANEASAALNSAALEIVSKLGLRQGEMGEALAEAARGVLDGKRPGDAAKGVLARVKAALAGGERIDGVRLATLDPPAPTPQAEALVDGFGEIGGKAAEAQAVPKGEEVGFEAPPDAHEAEAPPGLFDDLADAERPQRAADRLRACIPGL